MDKQLKMIFSRHLVPVPAVPPLPRGFRLKAWREGDDLQDYMALREASGFLPSPDSNRSLAQAMATLRPGGFLLVEEAATGRLAASAMSCTGYHENFGNLSWVMTHPDFRGHGLGRLVCAEALRISLAHGAGGMTLTTDDFREAALRLYLKLGWRPWLYDDVAEMRARWQTIRQRLDLPAATKFIQ